MNKWYKLKGLNLSRVSSLSQTFPLCLLESPFWDKFFLLHSESFLNCQSLPSELQTWLFSEHAAPSVPGFHHPTWHDSDLGGTINISLTPSESHLDYELATIICIITIPPLRLMPSIILPSASPYCIIPLKILASGSMFSIPKSRISIIQGENIIHMMTQ